MAAEGTFRLKIGPLLVVFAIATAFNFHSCNVNGGPRTVVGLVGGVVHKTVATHKKMRAHRDPCLPRSFFAALGSAASISHRARWNGRHAALALLFIMIGVTTASPAKAELNLQWDAPPTCPGRGEVLARIRALAGTSLDKFEGLSADGRITRTNGRFSLTLSLRDGRQHRKRVITSDSCADLAGAAAITLALLLGVDTGAADPSALHGDARGQTATQEGEPEKGDRKDGASAARAEQPSERGTKDRENRSEAPERGPVPADTATTPSDPSVRRWNVFIRAPILAADLGPLPDPSVGVGLGGGIGYASWRFLVTGHLYRGQSVTATEPGATYGAGADLERITGHLGICRGWRSIYFEVAPCVGMTLEHATASGFGQGVSPATQTALWVAPSAGALLHWYAMKSLALFVGVQGDLELSRPRIVIDALGEVRQLGPVSARIMTGMEWIL